MTRGWMRPTAPVPNWTRSHRPPSTRLVTPHQPFVLPSGCHRRVEQTSSKFHPDEYDYQEHDPDDGDDGIDGTPGGPTRDFGGRRFPVVGGKFITLVDHYWARLPHIAPDYTIYPIPTVPYAAKSGHWVGCLFKRAFVCHGCRIACRPGHVR